MKLLCLCDSPTLQTGFARVAQNLISRWSAAEVFEDIWVWGIGYGGFPHSIDFLSNRICPATTISRPEWYHADNLNRFLNLLERDEVGGTPGGFTHLWMMQDTFLLWPMAEAVADICRKRGIRTLLYFPVDAQLDQSWTKIIESVDIPVAYCEFGRREAARAIAGGKNGRKYEEALNRILTIPHGVDTAIYRKLADPMRAKNRANIFNGKVSDDDFLMINVSQNQKRKGLAQSLQVLARLKAYFGKERNWKLFMHTPSENKQEQTDLRKVAEQLGLKGGEDVFFGNDSFKDGHPILPEDYLNAIYNICDLMLTTSYGEGWGLPITEAMAAGLVTAGPKHTSISELLSDDRGILFETLGSDVLPFDNSRLRPRSDVDDAAMSIRDASAMQTTDYLSLVSCSERCYAWAKSDFLSWDGIAKEWTGLFTAP
jgi:glycosyltransferase involved in cell wall biosynthesis